MKSKQLSIGLVFTIALFSFTLYSQSGYEIQVELENYKENKILLAEQYGDTQYIIDSALVVANRKFTLKGKSPLEEGVYYLVLLPGNDVVQFLVDDKNQNFSLQTNSEYPVSQMKIQGSPLNQAYYNYIQFLGEQQVKARGFQEQLSIAKASNNEDQIQVLSTSFDQLDIEVEEKQRQTIEENKGSILATILKANLPMEMPDFSKTEFPRYEEYMFTKSHWFDQLNLQDPRLLRTSVMSEKINHYLDKLTHPEVDSITAAVDFFLDEFSTVPATYNYYLINFLNKYASAPQIGMDAVYVHLSDNYFAKGKAKFADEDQVKKIVKQADDMRATLLGEVAPNITLQEIDYLESLKVKEKKDEKKRWVTKRDFSLHDIDAEYTVLFLWSPTCDHCKKSMPDVKSFYENYKSKGVELVAICNQNYKGMPLCAEYIEEKEIFHWINGVDPYLKSRYKQLYNVRTYPQLFILDKNKKIVMKQFEANQLGFLMDKILAGEL